MQRRRIGQSDIEIAPLALGGWLTFGEGVGDDVTHRLLAAALEAGVNFVDLADVYAHGGAEQVVGRFLKTRRRDEVVLSSKVYWPVSEDPRDRGLGQGHVTRSIDRSLQRLGVEYLDLYFCHREDRETPLEETVEVMGGLVRDGKIRAWGTSCWREETLDRAHAIARELGLAAPIVEQPQLSLLHRWAERDVLPVAQRLGMGVVAFSPLAGGVLTGKYVDGRPAGTRGAETQWLDADLTPANIERVQRFVAVADRVGVAPSVLALAWVVALPGVTAAITGATSVAQLEANLAAAQFAMTPELMAELDRIFAAQRTSFLRRLLRRLRGLAR